MSERFPETEHTSDVEIWLDEEGWVRLRFGYRIIDWLPEEARQVGLALVELADAAVARAEAEDDGARDDEESGTGGTG